MAFVTSRMWEDRIGRLDDVAEFQGVPVAVARMWGRPLVKRFVGEWLRGDTKALPNGREFRLSDASVLRWERHPNPASLPLALDGGDALKETIVIEKRPSRTELTFEIDLPPGSTLLYQPPLTPEEAAAGCIRPPEIVGSFAVYGPMGEKTGHLLRPHATDAGGRFEWLDLDAMELPNRPGTWQVRILPRSLAWLNEAVWPVTIDPTFGYTSVGASYGAGDGSTRQRYQKAAPSDSGNVESLTIYGKELYSSNTITLGLCNWGAGWMPTTLLRDGAGVATTTSAAWRTDTLDSVYAVTSGTNYALTLGYGSSYFQVYFDTGGTDVHAQDYGDVAYSQGTLHAPSGPNYYGGGGRIMSFYATIAEAATGQPFIKRFGGVPFAALNQGVW